jgi:hypothetical protein
VKFINSACSLSKLLHVSLKQNLLHEERILNCRGLLCEVHKLSIMSIKITSCLFKQNFLHEERILSCRGLLREVQKLSTMFVKITSCLIQTEFTSRRENFKLQSSVVRSS